MKKYNDTQTQMYLQSFLGFSILTAFLWEYLDIVWSLQSAIKTSLKVAMEIVQDHAGREQYRHAQLYNRKVKGSSINIGDRVLMANKKDRGK